MESGEPYTKWTNNGNAPLAEEQVTVRDWLEYLFSRSSIVFFLP